MNRKSIKITLLVLFSATIILVLYFSNALQASFAQGRHVYLEKSDVHTVAIDSNGQPWVLEGDFPKCVVKVLEGNSWKTFSPGKSGFPAHEYDDLIFDLNGNLWLKTVGAGLVKYDGKHWETITTKNSELASDMTSAIAVDNQGRIWIIYHTASKPLPGVTVFDGVAWKTYNTANSGLPTDEVYTVAFDANNRAWFGTKLGLSIFDGEQWVTYTPENSGLASAAVLDIAFDDENRAWLGLGGDNEGVATFDGKNWKFFTPDEMGLSGGHSLFGYNIFVDQLGRVWIWAYEDKLRIFDHGVWIALDDTNAPLYVSSIATDQQGNIWISRSNWNDDSNNGLIKLDVDYRIPSESKYLLFRIYRIVPFVFGSLILAILFVNRGTYLVLVKLQHILFDIIKKNRIIFLVIASVIFLPSLILGGLLAGFSWGARYTDLPIFQTLAGGFCGGVIGVGIVTLLWIKFSQRSSKSKPQK